MERQAEVMGRAATELAIQLLGGQHRLAPTNMHQVPTAVFLCGTSQVGTFGISAARHLASHGAKTQVGWGVVGVVIRSMSGVPARGCSLSTCLGD